MDHAIEPSARNPVFGPARDLARRPVSALLWWVLPFVLAEASDMLRLSVPEAAWIWGAAMAWMGAGCALNAVRCHRLHCFIAAPALMIAALVAAMIAVGVLDLGPHGLMYVTWAGLGGAGLSFAPELVWRKYP